MVLNIDHNKQENTLTVTLEVALTDDKNVNDRKIWNTKDVERLVQETNKKFVLEGVLSAPSASRVSNFQGKKNSHGTWKFKLQAKQAKLPRKSTSTVRSTPKK